jgi:peptidoglycan/LPS O-acetylase OafA/YrhL
MVNRYKSMDFLRAAAILLVVLAHSVYTYGAPAYLAPLQFGGNGVDLFFVLSGWLLGGQLFKEIRATGSVEVKRFWVRRWMRTLPLYFVVFFLLCLQQSLKHGEVILPWQYLVFIQNYYMPLNFFSISWSLAVEEQFYIIIALFLLISSKFKKSNITLLLICLLLIPVVLRLSGLYDHPKQTHVRFDGCIAGVLISQIYYQYHSLWEKLQKYLPLAAGLSLCLYLSFYVLQYIAPEFIGNPDKLILVLIFSSWIMLANSNQYWRCILYFPGASFIATRSYAFYLVHPESLAIAKKVLINENFIIFFAFVIVVGLILADVLHRLVEKPFMDAREAFKFSSSKLF